MNWMVARSSGRSKRCHATLSLPVYGESRNPLQAPDANDRPQPRHEGNRLSGVHPVGIDQEPGRRLVGKVDDDQVQRRPRPWRIRYEDRLRRWLRDSVSFAHRAEDRRRSPRHGRRVSDARQHAKTDTRLDETGLREPSTAARAQPRQRRRVGVLGHAREGDHCACPSARFLAMRRLQDRLEDMLGQSTDRRDGDAVAHQVVSRDIVARQR